MASRLPRQPPDYLAQPLPSWQLLLRAERKSESTVKTYSEGAQGLLRWCTMTGTPAELTKPAVQEFTTHLLSEGVGRATARSRQLAQNEPSGRSRLESSSAGVNTLSGITTDRTFRRRRCTRPDSSVCSRRKLTAMDITVAMAYDLLNDVKAKLKEK